MQFKFDANLSFQADAVNSVVELFDGQHLAQGDFEIRFQNKFDFLAASAASFCSSSSLHFGFVSSLYVS